MTERSEACDPKATAAASAYVPERGDLVWINFHPQAGREQDKRRPAVVPLRAAYNGCTSLALLCPVTSRVKGYPFEVALPPGLRAEGVVLADQVRSLDWRARDAVRLDVLPPAVLAEVLARVLALLR